MCLGEQSAFFIRKSPYSASFCQSAVMTNICYCPQIFGQATDGTCVCDHTLVFVVTLIGIQSKLALS